MHDKQQILTFISEHPHMVVSSINEDGKPESAVVGFGQTDSFQLVFGTKATSRKAKNMVANGTIAVVIGWDSRGTVQYNGRARLLRGDEADYYAEFHFHKHPRSRLYKDDPNEVYFLIEPTWLRFTEVDFDPWKITEVTF